jgi:dolichyl-phosphate mannosyltransferase polypeptide 2 regulatory subunit
MDSLYGTILTPTDEVRFSTEQIMPHFGTRSNFSKPFVDEDHPLHSLFPPRVWAIRIPVILIILGTTVVGSFLSVVMIRSNRKKALKAKQKKAS